MDKNLKRKIKSLDPKTREKIENVFNSLSDSISVLYDLATHDEKTGLYNNKFFVNVFDMEFEKARRNKEKLSLVLIDIDFFKKINDTYGHIKADEMLERLGRVIKKQIRKSDLAARFGGEEFILLLPETNILKTKKFLSRLRSAIKSDSFLKKYHLMVSGGFTEYKKGDTKTKMKERADKALYKAKHTGRDKFVSM
jgi:diguanylate cyclase (GGDEF)-like protein